MSALNKLYEKMFLIRLFEEKVLQLFSSGKIIGTTHTYIGQEANAVGIINNLQNRDIIFSNHRCHGHYIAFTGDILGLICEIMGKAKGVCGGKGGSQHLHAENFYSNGIQGGVVPCATGIALAEKLQRKNTVTTVFIGDGTLGQGVVYESLNMASLWNLPLFIVLENNYYAQTTHIRYTVAGKIRDRAHAFNIESLELTTTDVEEIARESKQIIKKVRQSQKPFFLVINTYRFSAHSKGDDFRDPKEINKHKKKDPLIVAGGRLTDKDRKFIEKECRARLEEVFVKAEKEFFPTCEGIA